MTTKRFALIITGIILVLSNLNATITTINQYIGESSSEYVFTVKLNSDLPDIDEVVIEETDFQLEEISTFVLWDKVHIKMPYMELDQLKEVSNRIYEHFKAYHNYGDFYYSRPAFNVNEMDLFLHLYYLYPVIIAIIGMFILIYNVLQIVLNKLKLMKYREAQYEKFKEKNVK